jgi:Uma2 family endonuclease
MAVISPSRVETARKPAVKSVPPLQNGDRLTRAEFERRYHAMPNVKKAELIEGIVYMPSPVSLVNHASPHYNMIGWLFLFTSTRPELIGGDNGTLRLDLDNEPQPDGFVLIDPIHGGQAKISEDGYVEGAPELIVEVSSSTVSIDLHTKFNVYRRNGVKEYIVWRVQDEEIDWFVLENEEYKALEVDAEGLYRSEALPGLVLDPVAMIAGDLKRVIEVQVERGQRANTD